MTPRCRTCNRKMRASTCRVSRDQGQTWINQTVWTCLKVQTGNEACEVFIETEGDEPYWRRPSRAPPTKTPNKSPTTKK